MGLILSKTTSFEMKEFPSEPRIPPMYFKKHEDPNFVNGNINIETFYFLCLVICQRAHHLSEYITYH